MPMACCLGRCRGMPVLPWRATHSATDPADGGLTPIVERLQLVFVRYRLLAWPRFSTRGCRLVGPNPFLTPFNVFGPLTSCLIFGVHSMHSTPAPSLCTPIPARR